MARVTQAELARELGITRQSLSYHVDRGVVELAYDQRVDLRFALHRFRKYARGVAYEGAVAALARLNAAEAKSCKAASANSADPDEDDEYCEAFINGMTEALATLVRWAPPLLAEARPVGIAEIRAVLEQISRDVKASLTVGSFDDLDALEQMEADYEARANDAR